jgi:class 3 adenylate cyclase
VAECDHVTVPGGAEPTGALSASALPSGDVTFLMTDIEGSTTLLRDLGEERYTTILDEIRRLQQSAAEAVDGVLVAVEGDGCFFAFPSPTSALDACEAMQSGLHELALCSDPPVHVRMGLHRGRDVRPVGDNYAALSVHQTARVSSAAHGGQVLVTDDVASVGVDRCVNLGLFGLRDFDGPTVLYAVRVATGDLALRPPHALPTGLDSFPRYRTSFVGRDDDQISFARRCVTPAW